MATINTKQAGASMQITQFGGIDRRGRICDIDNLRLQTDGTLKRRCGYALALTLDGTVRGVWSGSFNGEDSTFAVAGDKLVRLDLDAGTWSEIGTITAGEEKVALFLYRGKLFCLDGAEIRIYDGSALTTASPYVPLVSRERGALDKYNVYEPINLITRKARFEFHSDGTTQVFHFGCAVSSITSVYNTDNGTIYGNTYYKLGHDSQGNSYINISPAPDNGTDFLVQVTLDAKYLDYARIATCQSAVVYGGSYDDRILCWGGGEASEMFCSRSVTETQVAQAAQWGVSSGDLYFPADGRFFVGDGRYAIRAACRHYDRLLVFTDGDTWMADFTSSAAKQFPLFPINSGIGCTAPEAAAMAGNNPLTVADGLIWRWTSNALRRDECSAACLADGIADMFGSRFSSGAITFSCRGRNEVWFADPSDESGKIYIYHIGLDAWYRFSGIRADGFFPSGNDVGFWCGQSFYRFDESRMTDLDTDGEHVITAHLALENIALDNAERMNHLTRMALHLRGAYPSLSITFETDLGRVRTVKYPAGGEAGQGRMLDRPLHSGRFRSLRMSLTAEGDARLHLCGVTLTAEPGERK